MLSQKNQISQVLVERFNLAENATHLTNFQGLSRRKGNQRGYVLGVHILVNAALTNGGALALDYEAIWRLMRTITLRAKGHKWFDSVDGRLATIWNILRGIIVPTNADSFAVADVPGAAPLAIVGHDFLIPLAPGYYQGSDYSYDGCYPIDAFIDAGELTITAGADADMIAGWTIDAAGIGVTIALDVLWSYKAIECGPWQEDHQTTANSNLDLARTAGKYEGVIVLDSAFGAFTQPTVQVSAQCEDLRVLENLTGLDIIRMKSAGMLHAINGLFTNGVLPLVHPLDVNSMTQKVTGSPFTIQDAGATHVGGGGTPLYSSIKWVELPDSTQAELLVGLGVSPEVVRNAGSRSIGGTPVTSMRKSDAEIMGMTKTVKES